MRKHIDFGISAALIVCALVVWTICGVHGTDALSYRSSKGSYSYGVSFSPYLPIRELQPTY
jgi:hypothetical protein